MPYGSNFWNRDRITWLPDTDRYPKAWGDQWTMVPEWFGGLPLFSSWRQSPPADETAVFAAWIASVLDNQ